MFTRHEIEILSTLWKEDRELTKHEIIDLTPDKKWKVTSVDFLLNSLLDKDAIKISGAKRSPDNRRYSRSYSPLITQEEYASSYLNQVMPRADISGVFSALVDTRSIDMETIERIRCTLDRMERELEEQTE